MIKPQWCRLEKNHEFLLGSYAVVSNFEVQVFFLDDVKKQLSCYPKEFVFELSCLFISQNMHQGYPTETLVRFLKAREWHVNKAQKMVVLSAAIFLFIFHIDGS